MSEDSRTIITQRNTPCYESDKVGPDPHFWSYFHANWYQSVYESKRTPIVPMQWTDWYFLEKHKKDCPAFRDVIEMCEYHGLKKIMAFQYDWNEEVILKFHSTFFFHKNSTNITWMTNGMKYSISICRFASIFGLGAFAKHSLNLHDGNVLGLNTMASMYETSNFQAPTITNFMSEMIVLHRVIRKTLERVIPLECLNLREICSKPSPRRPSSMLSISLFKRCGALLSQTLALVLMLHTL
jgi:hypothetical protein